MRCRHPFSVMLMTFFPLAQVSIFLLHANLTKAEQHQNSWSQPDTEIPCLPRKCESKLCDIKA